MGEGNGERLISAEGLGKQYGFPPLNVHFARLRNRLTPGPPKPLPEDSRRPWALRDVSLSLSRGEAIGILGVNGAGKSTLLKVLCGVTPATEGALRVNARIFPMIELNAGVHVELTGEENARILGAVMGLSPDRMDAVMEDIHSFSELGEFFYKPVRTYSSGMKLRLGFSVAINVDAEVLLIDEVLAVGDMAFRKKCFSRLFDVQSAGGALILVSHNVYQIERLCDRAILLDGGRVVKDGRPGDVVHDYFVRLSARREGKYRKADLTRLERPGTGDLRVSSIELVGEDGTPRLEFPVGGALTIRLAYRLNTPVNSPNVGFHIFSESNTLVASLEATSVRPTGRIETSGSVTCAIRALNLLPGTYSLHVKIANEVTIDQIENALEFSIAPDQTVSLATGNKGIVVLDAEWGFAEHLAPDLEAPEV